MQHLMLVAILACFVVSETALLYIPWSLPPCVDCYGEFRRPGTGHYSDGCKECACIRLFPFPFAQCNSRECIWNTCAGKPGTAPGK